MAKARVAPIKELTVPKLELMVLLLAARMAKFIKESYEKDGFVELFVWLDSKVTRSWLVSKSVLPVFVKNRVQEIDPLIPEVVLSYLATDDNPSDWLTHGDNLNGNTHLLKVKKVYRTTAWTLRYLNNCRSSTSMKRHGELTLEELQEAKNKTIAIIQRKLFQEEYKSLMKGIRKPKLSLVHQLNLYPDNGVISCKGRLEHAQLPESVKFPILLPKSCFVTRVIIKEHHDANAHMGVNATVVSVRREFWIPQIRQLTKYNTPLCYLKENAGKAT
ncbi:uncharacterized protein [Macrobrachium rosenbergii]|uniref:uncharacterized protein n=1 Tax=Macrobrachium rosenbergii TaxID=79674 RepID=UPI0034D6F555